MSAYTTGLKEANANEIKKNKLAGTSANFFAKAPKPAGVELATTNTSYTGQANISLGAIDGVCAVGNLLRNISKTLKVLSLREEATGKVNYVRANNDIDETLRRALITPKQVEEELVPGQNIKLSQ